MSSSVSHVPYWWSAQTVQELSHLLSVRRSLPLLFLHTPSFLFPMYSVVEHPILKTAMLSPFSRLKEFLLTMSYLVPFVTLGTVCLNCCDHNGFLRLGLQKLLVPDHLLTLIHLINADWTSVVTKFPSYWKAHSEEAYCLYLLMNVTTKISSCGLFLAYLSSPKVFNSTWQTHNTRVSFCIKNLTLHWFSSTTAR